MPRVVALHIYSEQDPDRAPRDAIEFEIDGIVGDRSRGLSRTSGSSDKQAKGTVRRNERMWSAISTGELEQISKDMDLARPLTAADVSINLCLDGVDELSKLPKGSLLNFPSGLVLVVEEFCAPCLDKGRAIAESIQTSAGGALQPTAFSKAAKFSRGLLGVVDVPGVAKLGDEVEIIEYAHPKWLARV